MTKKSRKKRWIFFGLLFTIILGLTLSINIILSGVLRTAVNFQLEELNKIPDREFSIGEIRLNIFSRALILSDVSVKPDSATLEKLKLGKYGKANLMSINIATLKIRSLEIYKLLTEHYFALRSIKIKGAEITIFKNLNIEIEEKEADTPFSIDSIRLAGLKGINFDKVVFNKFYYTTINIANSDTIFSFHGSEFELKGLTLETNESSNGYFRINTEDLFLKMNPQRIDFRNNSYFVYFLKLKYFHTKKLLTIYNLKVKPTQNKYKLGASYKYNKEVFDVDLKLLNIYGYQLDKEIQFGEVIIDSILVDGLKLEIYKDANRPFDLNKRPLFLQQTFKNLEFPLHISKVKISNSLFKFALRPKGSRKLLKVDISKLNGELSFLTSHPDSIILDKKLTININGILMDAATLNLNIIMPYDSPVDTFYFAGTLGSGDFKKFNSALYPATGIKFEAGHLNSLKFYAYASPKGSKGLMTMLYDGLKADIPKKDVKKKNKFLSFSANAVLRSSNPTKKGKTRVALAQFKRVEYKGFGNLLWKTVQSGLLNTILPIGKSHKEENTIWDYQSTNKESGDKTNSKDKKKKWWKKKH